MQQTGVAFVPVVSSDEAGASFVGCVYFHLLEDVLNEFEELAAHRLAQEAPSARLAAARAAIDWLPARGDANRANRANPAGVGAAGGTEETLDLLWRDGPASEARGEPPRDGTELAPLQISKHMRLSRVTFLFRMLGVSYACVTESGRLLGVLTCLDLVEDAKGMVRSPRGAAAQVGTVACLGISRGNSLESTSSSRRSSTESAASCDANKELL